MMTNNKTYDPYEAFHKYSQLWEKQINDFIYLWTNNNEFVKMAGLGSELHARNIERFKKNQETVANLFNLPTKSDVENVAALTIQAEDKIEALEEQIWELQDSVKSQSKEIETVVEVSKEIIKLTKQLKTELVKTKKEQSETKNLSLEIQELKQELYKLNSFKDEFENLKVLLEKEKAEEPVLAGAGTSK